MTNIWVPLITNLIYITLGSERSKYLRNRGSCQTSLSTRYDLSMQASIHAHYVPACTGPYLSQIGSDQRDQNIYGIRTCWTSGAHNLTRARRLACIHTMCLHTQAHISAKLGWIREIKVSMELNNMLDLSEHIMWPEHVS